eukprot:scaffold23675_cov129-Isochrysis_galbana.AAC.2
MGLHDGVLQEEWGIYKQGEAYKQWGAYKAGGSLPGGVSLHAGGSLQARRFVASLKGARTANVCVVSRVRGGCAAGCRDEESPVGRLEHGSVGGTDYTELVRVGVGGGKERVAI